MRPEEEDAQIANEWSPRGGRKQCIRERHGCSQGSEVRVDDDSTDGGGGLAPPTESFTLSSSRSQFHGRGRRIGGDDSEGKNRGSGHHNKSSTTSPVAVHERDGVVISNKKKSQNQSLSQSPRNTRRRYLDFSQRVVESSWSSTDDGQSGGEARFGDSSDDFSGCENCDAAGDTSFERWLASSCPAKSVPLDSSDVGNIGNLGGRFALPASPYRTYRAKHSRIIRARSSERAASETRRRWREREDDGALRRRRGRRCRSMSADPGRRRGHRGRRGTSGMASNLLRGEGFGLLESNVTGKISLGRQLPRDQFGTVGKARAAAAAIGGASRCGGLEEGMACPTPEQKCMTPFRLHYTARQNRQRAHRRRGWLRVHHRCDEGSVSFCETTEGINDDGDLADGIGTRENGRRGCSITRQFIESGLSWPSASAQLRFKPTAGTGSSRQSRMRSTRHGGNAGHCSLSWSPPRTGTGTCSVGSYTTTGTDGDILYPASRGRRGGETDRGGSNSDKGVESSRRRHERIGSAGNAGECEGHYRSRSCSPVESPLNSPLDPYRSSCVVARAGTLVPRRDVAHLEQAARKSSVAMRMASKARRRVDSASEGLSVPPPYHRRKNEIKLGTKEGGARRDDWNQDSSHAGRKDGWMEERRIQLLLPSVELMDRELEAIRRADKAMREEELAQVYKMDMKGRGREGGALVIWD